MIRDIGSRTILNDNSVGNAQEPKEPQSPLFQPREAPDTAPSHLETGKEIKAALDFLNKPTRSKEIAGHFDTILNALKENRPANLEDIQKAANKAKSSVSDGFFNMIKKWISPSHKKLSEQIDAQHSTILKAIGAYEARSKQPAIEQPLASADFNFQEGDDPSYKLLTTQQQLEETKARLENSLEQQGALGKELDPLRLEHAASKDQLSKLQEEHSALQAQLEQALKVEVPSAAMHEDAEELDPRLADLSRQLDSKAAALETAQAGNADKDKEIQGIQQELEQVQQKMNDLQQAKEALSNTNAQLGADVQGMLDANAEIEKENGELHQRNVELNGDMKKLQAAHADELEAQGTKTVNMLVQGLEQRLSPELYQQVLEAIAPKL